jgi:pyridoxal phosphate enzyme (YggS family)
VSTSPDPTDVAAVAARLAQVTERIERAGGDPGAISVLAVTKGFGPDAVAAARAAGVFDVGENYAGELESKRVALDAAGSGVAMRWHFLGALQTNKIAALAPHVDCWQSVSRAVEGERIARARPGATVLIQVAFSGDERRPGCEPEGVPTLARTLNELGLDLRGLMAVAPRQPEAAKAAFATVRRLADQLSLPVRSIGMTEDLELAVAGGSTMVRVGRALFGDRPPPGRPAG